LNNRTGTGHPPAPPVMQDDLARVPGSRGLDWKSQSRRSVQGDEERCTQAKRWNVAQHSAVRF